ncbi:MAG: helix-turn-helix transcriptional regulator [bacterium]|nr:helix-turn-helix transcriptional regulator [bacterium]
MKSLLENNKNVIIIFLTYMFSFLLTEQIINKNIYDVLGDNYVVHVYAICILFTAIGYLLFGLLKNRKSFLIISELAFIICMIANIIFQSGLLNVVYSILSTLSFGYIGGSVHFQLSQNLSNKKDAGKIIGFSLAIALILQYFSYNYIENNHFLLGIIIASSIVLLIVILNKSASNCIINEDKKKKTCMSFLIFPIVVVAIISIICGLQDGVITSLDAKGYMNVYGIGRFSYIIGIIVAGFIADTKSKNNLLIATICTTLISIAGIIFLQDPSEYVFNVITIFLMGSFYVMYLTLTFINLASFTKNPRLWSGMGRIIRSITTALIVVPSEMLFKSNNYNLMIIISVLLAVILLVIFYIDMNKSFQNKAIKNVEDFLIKYSFTNKEKEICTFILKDNMKTKEIADYYKISERSVERHLTSIYEKTGVKSRTELYNMFYDI